MTTYTEQDVIELFNGDQTEIFKQVAAALTDRNLGGLFVLLCEQIDAMNSKEEAPEAHEALIAFEGMFGANAKNLRIRFDQLFS